jgi:hypothetical protein
MPWRCVREGRQWLIIQGRRAGKVFAPSAERPASDLRPLQQVQPRPCFKDRFGSLAARSLVACAALLAAGMPAKAGAVSITRGAGVPHAGQNCAALRSLIVRIVVKLPHFAQSYS